MCIRDSHCDLRVVNDPINYFTQYQNITNVYGIDRHISIDMKLR